MASVGKYQNYYNRIKEEVKLIKDQYGYQNLSKSFAHWYLVNIEGKDNDEMGEIIIDGDGDNGVDAIIIDGSCMKIYQFKFPDSLKTLDKCIDETTALKLLNGYKKLTSSNTLKKANDNFLTYKERIKEESIFNYDFVFVCYQDTLSIQAKDDLDVGIEEIKNTTGNEIKVIAIDKKKICDLFDKKEKKNALSIEMKYSALAPSYNIGEEVKSWMGMANAKEIITACKDHMDVVFDENIRNYEGDNDVNEGIIKTASDETESKNFFFYHNGIVFICNKCNLSIGNQMANMTSAAIVNGCQTVVSIKKAFDSNTLKDNVFIPIRIIETTDMDLRANITEYLNSQTKIRDSYFLANNTFIRKLQNDLISKGYYLERLTNEYSYKHSLGKIQEYEKSKVLPLEKTVQIYIAYFDDANAATAKRGKNELFDKNKIDGLLSCITAEKVIEANETYSKISAVITKYRKCRRVDRNDEFLSYLGIDSTKLVKEKYDELMDEYVFMNTGDMLLLNIYRNTTKEGTFDEKIKEVISICKDIIIQEYKQTNVSSATKNSAIFEKCRKKANPSTDG